MTCEPCSVLPSEVWPLSVHRPSIWEFFGKLSEPTPEKVGHLAPVDLPQIWKLPLSTIVLPSSNADVLQNVFVIFPACGVIHLRGDSSDERLVSETEATNYALHVARLSVTPRSIDIAQIGFGFNEDEHGTPAGLVDASQKWIVVHLSRGDPFLTVPKPNAQEVRFSPWKPLTLIRVNDEPWNSKETVQPEVPGCDVLRAAATFVARMLLAH